MQEVYNKKVVHRIVGVRPKATVMQDDRQLSGIVQPKGGGASIVQSVWEPAERCEETEDGEPARKRQSSSSRTVLSREVIDVDADEEESRYEITGRKGRRMREVIDVDTTFTTDSGSEDGEGAKGEQGGPAPVKINRKRAFWASKAGTAAAGLGT